MNWRVGFFRLWIVLTASWIALVGLVAYGEVVPLSRNAFSDLIPVGPLVLKYAIAALIGPALLFGLGAIFLWIGDGFRRNSH